MHTIDKLGEVLEKRASAQLDRDLLDIFKHVSEKLEINKGPLLSVQVDDGKPEQATSLYYILRYERRSGADIISSSTYMDQLRAALLPGYRDRVIAEFMQNVDSVGLQEAEE